MKDVFEVIAEPTRRRILDLLAGQPHSVGEVVAATGLSQPNASRHLRILRDAGLVVSRTQGQQRIYELREAGFERLFSWADSFRQG
jgi:DNA-binding transcriptional ArsR family regulator